MRQLLSKDEQVRRHSVLFDNLTFCLADHMNCQNPHLAAMIKRRGSLDTPIIVDLDLNVIYGGELLVAAISANIRPTQIAFELRPGLTPEDKRELVADLAMQRSSISSESQYNQQDQKEHSYEAKKNTCKQSLN